MPNLRRSVLTLGLVSGCAMPGFAQAVCTPVDFVPTDYLVMGTLGLGLLLGSYHARRADVPALAKETPR